MLIIHAADIHLGASPDPEEVWGKNRKQELWDSFERLIEETERQKADLLLIAGDLFHRQPLLRELREVNALFASLSKTKVVLVAGNHDHLGKTSFYEEFLWAENVAFLKGEKVQRVVFEDLKTDIYGLSYHRREICEKMYDEIIPESNGYYHILLAHGGDEKHIPYTKEKLENSGFDYIAFGHIHKPGMIIPGKAVMAGSLEPLDHTCRGIHGYVRVETEGGKNQITLIPAAKREYSVLNIRIDAEDTMSSLFFRIKEKIEEIGKDWIYDLELTGKCHPSLEILEEKLKSAGNIRAVHDHTEKQFDYEALKEAYFGSLLERYISSFGETSAEIEKEALNIGTWAILEALGI